MWLLAQQAAQAPTLWEDVIKGLAGNGLWVFLSVVFLLWSIETVSRQFMQHRERMAMIEAGLHPDRLGQKPNPAEPDEPSDTLDLRKSG
ncbi:MAG: hypothetical protein WDZ48_02275 [Pirellulales bacterium]